MHLALFSSSLFPAWLSHIPIDWIVIVAFILIVTFDAMRSGSGRASVLALAFPTAAFLSSLIPHAYFFGKLVSSTTSPLVGEGIFIVLFIITYLLAYRIVYTMGSISRGLMLSFLAGISAAIVVIVMWLQVPVLTTVWHFNSQVQTIFGSGFALFWLIGAYLILAFIRS
jgi:hypothetical protein